MRNLMFIVLAGGCAAPSDAVTDDTGAGTEPLSLCASKGWSERPWNAEGPFGEHRHELAADATLPLVGGGKLVLSEAWSGCDTWMFLPDTIAISPSTPESIWTRDVEALLRASPENAHWVFVSRQSGAAGERSATDMAARVEEALQALPRKDRVWWSDRVHVVRKPASELEDWVGAVLLEGIGSGGFAIDRRQQLRGVGSLSDVTRIDRAEQNADRWPWVQNLAMAARDARYLNAWAERQDVIDAQTVTVVPLFTGQVIEQFADLDVELPDAATLAGFDTLEVEIDMRCPNPDAIEFGNCGAWDYLAHLWVQEGEAWVELGRFITSYHRESHWVADLTPMLPLLAEGGTRRFRWEWAPEWNKQPTATRVSLRLRNQGLELRPAAITRLFTGGDFGSAYNEGRVPVDAPVSADAKKVVLWSNLTGHGGATNNCAEFCDHQHEITVNGTAHLRTHATVGEDEGCVGELKNGMVPNQWGTWWFGRGGWCPGQQVEPWVVDVTSEVVPGTPATVAYRGLYNGGTPPDGSGNILLNAWWVVYE